MLIRSYNHVYIIVLSEGKDLLLLEDNNFYYMI